MSVPYRSWRRFAASLGLMALMALPTTGAAVATDAASPPAADPDDLPPAELERRLRVQQQLPEFEATLRKRITDFGGVYRDHAGTIIVAATSASLDEALSAVGFTLAGGNRQSR